MLLSHFLKESENVDLRAIKDFLLKEAPNNANEIMNGAFIFRGVDNAREDDLLMTAEQGPLTFKLYGAEIPKKRVPKTTNSKIHGRLNDWLEEKYDSRYRENSLFVTNDFSQARGYGNVLSLVFPGSDNVEWFYSPDIYDLWDVVSSSPTEEFDPDDTGEWSAEVVKRFMESTKWELTTDVSQAYTRSGGEIMMHDASYSYYSLVVTNTGMRPVMSDMRDAAFMLRSA